MKSTDGSDTRGASPANASHSDRGPSSPPDGPLTGLRVVEVSAFVAAPLAGGTLAALGAEVIRVEPRGGGIDAGRWPLYEGRSLYREGLDQGKRSLTVDLGSSRGREIVIALATLPGPGCGVVLTNLNTDGWFSYDTMRRRRDDLIMLALNGTRDGRPAVDYTVNAGIGFPLVTGPPTLTNPVNHVLPAWDVAAGYLSVIGILTAERHRHRTGEGQLVTISLEQVAETVVRHLGLLAEAEVVPVPRARLGNYLYGSYGRDFETHDGCFVMIAALTPRQWKSLVQATNIGEPVAELELGLGVDLTDEGARYELRESISALIEPWVKARSLKEVRETFDASGILWGPYRTFKEFARDASTTAGPFVFGRFDSRPVAAGPRIGSDTDAILSSILGFSETELEDLRTDGVID